MTILDAIRQYFSYGELKTICFDLGIDWEDFGSNKPELIDGLLRYYRKTNQQEVLVNKLQNEREFLNWEDFTW